MTILNQATYPAAHHESTAMQRPTITCDTTRRADRAAADVISEGTPTSTSTMTPDSSSSSGEGEPSTTRAPGAAGTARRRPIPRKGHTKSRRGCFNCKKRKVKCTEGLPECDHCQRLGLICEYPPPRRYLGGGGGGGDGDGGVARRNDEPLSGSSPVAGYGAMAMAVALSPTSPSRPLHASPMAFSRDDLRFFSHFLLTAYPPLPLGGEGIWKQVAAMSYEYDFLIHAMLGLAASHLSLIAPAGFENQAISHRVAAIRLLNQALSTPCASSVEGDARFAAIMALTFQAAYMPEGGMMEFVSLIRGCNVVARSTMVSRESIFHHWTEDGHIDTVRSMNAPEPEGVPSDHQTIEAFLASLRQLAPDCRGSFELLWLGTIEKSLELAKTSSLQGFTQTARAYQYFGAASSEDFEDFTNPENFTAQLLMLHFFLVEHFIGCTVLGPVISSFLVRRKVNAAWVAGLGRDMPLECRQKFAWLQRFCGESGLSQHRPAGLLHQPPRSEDTGREMALRMKAPGQMDA
ncbi:hypothetical protein GGTG_00089 [Gaeumannomyces tritici R3-111a-1]|uniref:Zn(2)-C6 fungal-type domain-containing protein n=1 Tax=Gaeumannomyces tritici (strain R3-111a-1) TaxID=644352 RepID=J3NFP4_GAET3|nr:hypothetical protein GGTG_00089 [Gaeumannomyces tritici R3-111a-1]EJT80084.1 hypothetical protein GGTG_00089 [Gaeumannomyces tritici R3-111a-1]